MQRVYMKKNRTNFYVSMRIMQETERTPYYSVVSIFDVSVDQNAHV